MADAAPDRSASSATEFQEYDYTRSGNPTRSALEKLVGCDCDECDDDDDSDHEDDDEGKEEEEDKAEED